MAGLPLALQTLAWLWSYLPRFGSRAQTIISPSPWETEAKGHAESTSGSKAGLGFSHLPCGPQPLALSNLTCPPPPSRRPGGLCPEGGGLPRRPAVRVPGCLGFVCSDAGRQGPEGGRGQERGAHGRGDTGAMGGLRQQLGTGARERSSEEGVASPPYSLPPPATPPDPGRVTVTHRHRRRAGSCWLQEREKAVRWAAGGQACVGGDGAASWTLGLWAQSPRGRQVGEVKGLGLLSPRPCGPGFAWR